MRFGVPCSPLCHHTQCSSDLPVQAAWQRSWSGWSQVHYHYDNARKDRKYGKTTAETIVDTTELADRVCSSSRWICSRTSSRISVQAPGFRYVPWSWRKHLWLLSLLGECEAWGLGTTEYTSSRCTECKICVIYVKYSVLYFVVAIHPGYPFWLPWTLTIAMFSNNFIRTWRGLVATLYGSMALITS